MDLMEELRRALEGRTCLVGVGNDDLADDGLGPSLARVLLAEGADAVDAGTTPEDRLEEIIRGGFRNVVFLDAVEIDGPPGSFVLFDAGVVRSRFPQVSTHKISLGTLARVIEARSGARVWLLGVQPLWLRPGLGLSQPVVETLAMLTRLITDLLRGDGATAGKLPRPRTVADPGPEKRVHSQQRP